MWQTRIVSVSLLIVSASLCFAEDGERKGWQSELTYPNGNHQDSSKKSVNIVDVQATNIANRALDFAKAQPWILEVHQKSPAAENYRLFGWGILIDQRAVIISSAFDHHRRLVAHETFVKVGNDEIEVDSVVHERENDENPGYIILILSTPITSINAARLATRYERFKAGSECYTVAGIIPHSTSTKRVVVTGENEDDYIYTERNDCSQHSAHMADLSGVLVCQIVSGSSEAFSSSYVLASILRAPVKADKEKCEMIFAKIGNSRRWIDDALEGPNYHAYQREA